MPWVRWKKSGVVIEDGVAEERRRGDEDLVCEREAVRLVRSGRCELVVRTGAEMTVADVEEIDEPEDTSG